MKTVLSRLALMGAFALTSAFGVSGANAVTLQMNHQMPATAVGSKVDQWFADEIEKRTGGEVKIKIFWSEGLGKANETLSLLQSGAIDMAGLSPGYFPAQLPLFTAPNSSWTGWSGRFPATWKKRGRTVCVRCSFTC